MADDARGVWYAVTDGDWDWDTTEDGDGAPFITLAETPQAAARKAVEAWRAKDPNGRFDGGDLKVARVACVGFIAVEQKSDGAFCWDDFQWLGDPPRNENATSDIVNEIAKERRRQIFSEGFDADHDDNSAPGALARAAAVYAFSSTLTQGEHVAHRNALYGLVRGMYSLVAELWPWDARWFKPRAPRRDLVRAGALIVAAIERLDRAAAGDGVAE